MRRINGRTLLSGSDPARCGLALLIEMPQVRRLLILPDRHQQAIGAQEIILLADDDVLVVGSANILNRKSVV
jgi:hypothetical protein